MLMQVGGEGDRPTFFEMMAAQQISESLRAALMYSLGVIAQRRPVVHRILDHSDEAFALLMLALEAHNLRTTDASFSEALYGLRRQPVASGGNKTMGLTRKQRSLSLLFLVGLPYLKSKLHNAYTARRDSMLQNALFLVPDEDGSFSPETSTSGLTLYQRFKRKLSLLCAKCFPWMHATHEGLLFAYQLLYLLETTCYYSPALHLMAVHVRRASGQELMNATKHVQDRRSRDYQRVRGPAPVQALQRGLLKGAYTALDYAQTGLIAAVFLFKMMEWWYQSAEERVMTPTIYPVPPPPPAPKVAENGITLPADSSICPLCLEARKNPTMAAVSGYVFCYTCIYKYVTQYKRCPVTLMPTEVDKVRRLYRDD